MSTPVIVRHTGIATAISTWNGFGSSPVDTGFYGVYAAHKESQLDVIGATDMAPVVVPLENVIKVRVLIVKCTGNSLKLVLTSARGTDQAIPLSAGGSMVFHFPTLGDELTAIKLVGTGATVDYFIAGDLS